MRHIEVIMTTLNNSQDDGVRALQRLVTLCLRHQGGSTFPIIHFLMSLYNGEYYRPDMQLLCGRVDDGHFDDVVQVMRLYRSNRVEPHVYFKDGSQKFERLASMVRPIKRLR